MKQRSVHSRSWLCEDCTLVFEVHKVLRKTPFCPECGDRITVSRYTGIRRPGSPKSGPGSKITWKPEELALLEDCLAGKKLPYQVAILLGRPINSVTKRLGRLRKSKEQKTTE